MRHDPPQVAVGTPGALDTRRTVNVPQRGWDPAPTQTSGVTMSDGPAAGARRRVLITGASGFIGGYLLRALRDIGAVGASRPPAASNSAAGTTPYDPLDERSMTRMLEGAEALVHAAGRAHILREDAADSLHAFREGNVDTTRTAVRAAAAAGVGRFILLSSVAVYGESGGAQSPVWTEATPLAPTTPYGVSRMEAEEVALSEARGRLELVILRLPMVYGAGMKGNPLRLFDLVYSGRPIPLGAVSNARSTLGVDNVVFAVRRLLEVPLASPATFLVADAGTVSTPQFVHEIAQALGRPSRLWAVPLPVLRAVARLGTSVLGERFPLTPDALARLSGSLVVDASRLARAIGPAPVSREEGLRATARWYLESRGFSRAGQ